MSIVDQFIKQYNKEYDFYQELAKRVANKLEEQIVKRGIKAIVNHRAKRVDRLKEKLDKRDDTKKYKTIDDISTDIVDLAGVRASLYFPSEREVIDEIVNDIFVVTDKKKFPIDAHKPKYEKRFSGYWATHYRVKLKPDINNKRYIDNVVEIQVASILMHAWSEVEHDLVYKPLSGSLSKEELSILDEINGLVLTGEIALERLQKAMADRTKDQNSITDKYALTNFILSSIDKENINKIKLGNTFLLNNYYNNTNKIDANQLYEYLKRVNPEAQETITDQLLDMLISEPDDIEKLNLKNYFKTLLIPDKKASGFESFVKCWVLLEKAMRHIESSEVTGPILNNFTYLKNKKIISQQEVTDLFELRKIRNRLIHGIETLSDDYLLNQFDSLKSITQKIISKIPDTKIRSQLKKDLENLK